MRDLSSSSPSVKKGNMKIKVEKKSNDLTDTVFVASIEGTSLKGISINNKEEAVGNLLLSDAFQIFSKLIDVKIEDLTDEGKDGYGF